MLVYANSPQTCHKGGIALPTVYTSSPQELVVNRSRFIGRAWRLATPDQLEGLISVMRESFPAANHYTWAYRIREGLQRASDDGEPHGTAGLPVLHILDQEDWLETLVVVVRYFGGIKLGRGGLVRAYRQTAQLALAGTIPGTIRSVRQLAVQLSYGAYERTRRALAAATLTVEPQFGTKVRLVLEVLVEAANQVETILNQHAYGDWTLLAVQDENRLLPNDPSPPPNE